MDRPVRTVTRTIVSVGFDPGINHCAWAAVDRDKNVLACGLVSNPGPKSVKKGWDKLSNMIEPVEEIILKQIRHMTWYPRTRVWVAEGQYPGRGNPDHQVRNGWLSAVWYTLSHPKALRLIAVPATWTHNVPKEIRQNEMLESLPQAPLEWGWVGEIPKKSIVHNVYDAVGLALWGLEQHKNQT